MGVDNMDPKTPPFVMELPPYKWPNPRTVFNRVYDRAKAFVVRAGTLIFAVTVLIWAAPYIFLADEAGRQNGIRLMISHLRGFGPQNLDPRYKCLDRMHFQLAKMEALAAGYDDVVWLDDRGHVAEGPASNLFAVKGGTLYTPGEAILRGITRATILELAVELGIPVREANLTAFDLYSADEVFTTSTAGGVLPVREVSARPLRGPVPGPVSRRLDDAYWEMRASGRYGTEIDP